MLCLLQTLVKPKRLRSHLIYWLRGLSIAFNLPQMSKLPFGAVLLHQRTCDSLFRHGYYPRTDQEKVGIVDSLQSFMFHVSRNERQSFVTLALWFKVDLISENGRPNRTVAEFALQFFWSASRFWWEGVVDLLWRLPGYSDRGLQAPSGGVHFGNFIEYIGCYPSVICTWDFVPLYVV